MSKWISVTDRLPDIKQSYPYKTVLVKTESSFHCDDDFHVAYFHQPTPDESFGDVTIPAYDGYWELLDDMHIPFTVTHWMPIPAIEGIEQTTKGDQNA